MTKNTPDVVAPDGTQTANRILETAANAAHFFEVLAYNPLSPIVAGETAQTSIWVRGGGTLTATRRILTVWNDATGSFILFNPRTGLVDGSGGTATLSGEMFASANGWTRLVCYYKNPPPGQETNAGIVIWELDNGADGAALSNVYAGTTTAGLYLWGPSIGYGTTPIDYVPTGASAVAGNNPRGLVR